MANLPFTQVNRPYVASQKQITGAMQSAYDLIRLRPGITAEVQAAVAAFKAYVAGTSTPNGLKGIPFPSIVNKEYRWEISKLRVDLNKAATTVRKSNGLTPYATGAADTFLTGYVPPIVIPPVGGVSIFGFSRPATAPTTFPGSLLIGAEQTAADATKWSKQNGDAALTIAPGNISSDGTPTALRWIGYTDEEQAAVGDRITVLANITAASGNMTVYNSAISTNTVTNNNRIGWKQGVFNPLTSAAFPRVGVQFNPSVSGTATIVQAYNLTKLLAQKWAIVYTFGQSNGVGATATHDPNIDTPIEGCVVFPGSTNPYVGALLGTPMLAVDPINHQTLNGAAGAPGGGPMGSMLRELRKSIPSDYTIVLVALNYAGQGFKTNGLWNKNTSNPTAYTGFWSEARSVYSKAPAGSIVLGALGCTGESDLGSGNEVEWASTVSGVPALINEMRAEPGWGQVPVVFMELGMPLSDANVQSMIALQKKYATGSGDPLSMPRLAYVPRPANWALEADNVHYTQATHRQRGIDAANGLLKLIYPS